MSRNDESKRILYGRHPVRTALSGKKRGSLHLIWATPPIDAKIERLAHKAKVEVVSVSRRRLDALVGRDVTHQGVAALCGSYPYGTLESLLHRVDGALDEGRAPLLIVLDRIQDPRNLGAIVRSAVELGGDAVVIGLRRAAAVTAAAVKTAAGATEQIEICRVVNIAKTLAFLSDAGVTAIGSTDQGGPPPEALDWTGPCALVLGCEGSGVRPGVLTRCRHTVTIPTTGQVGSLNVSVAAGILLAEAARQRRNN
jgi:23S rRNA (guanosine2251-2'-O)-methyltransferase